MAARISTLIHDILVRTPDFFVVTSYPAPNRDLKAYFDLAPPTRNGQVPSTEKGIVARPLAISVGVIASLFWPTGAEVYRSWSAVVADPDLRGSSTLVVNRLGSSELRGRWRFSELITIEPKWGKENQHRPLTPVCREAFKRIDLRWHDLRHEYASRLVERGVPLSQVRDLLGNASIATTERFTTTGYRRHSSRLRSVWRPANLLRSLTQTPTSDETESTDDDAKVLEELKKDNGVSEGNRTPNIRSHSPALYP